MPYNWNVLMYKSDNMRQEIGRYITKHNLSWVLEFCKTKQLNYHTVLKATKGLPVAIKSARKISNALEQDFNSFFTAI